MATPPHVGPILHSSKVRDVLRHPHLMPYTRGDGRLNCITRSDGTTPYFPGREGWCEGRVDGKMPTVDDTRLLLEDREEGVAGRLPDHRRRLGRDLRPPTLRAG